jgi:hypothetical protein
MLYETKRNLCASCIFRFISINISDIFESVKLNRQEIKKAIETKVGRSQRADAGVLSPNAGNDSIDSIIRGVAEDSA